METHSLERVVPSELPAAAPLRAAEAPARPARPVDKRIAALRRFAIAITVLNLLGRTFFGFEQSWAQMVVCLVTAHGLELLLEWVASRVEHRQPLFLGGGVVKLVDFLLPAHITGLAVSMLLHGTDRYLPFAFAVSVGIGSKALLTAPTARGPRHFMNPSNFGLAVAFLLLPDTVSGVPPYHFTAHLTSFGDWLLPLVVICTGSLLNARLTGRMPLIAAWLSGFLLQALIRHFAFGESIVPMLSPMTGIGFLLFTLYMVPDPGTTPVAPRRQIYFGFAVALVYGALVTLHVSFGFFFALALVCLGRGAVMYATHYAPAVAAVFAARQPSPAVGDGAGG